jgi:antitoxin StbD
MAIPKFSHVLPVSEARGELSRTLERFRRDGIAADPLVFGNHRQAEGVVIPFPLFEALLPLLEDVQIAEVVRERLADPAPNRPGSELLGELGFSAADVDVA